MSDEEARSEDPRGNWQEKILYPEGYETLFNLESGATVILATLIKTGVNNSSPTKYIATRHFTNLTSRTIEFVALNGNNDEIHTYLWNTNWLNHDFSDWDNVFNINYNGNTLISLPWTESLTLYENEFTSTQKLLSAVVISPNTHWVDLNGITLLGH